MGDFRKEGGPPQTLGLELVTFVLVTLKVAENSAGLYQNEYIRIALV